MLFGFSFFPDFVLLALGALVLLVFAFAALVFWKEKEARAFRVALLLAVVGGALLAVWPFLPGGIVLLHVKYVVLFLILGAALLLFFPVSLFRKMPVDDPAAQLDERDVMFSRNELRRDTKHFEEYYRRHPEKREADERFRKNPGLLSEDARYFLDSAFKVAESNFDVVERLNKEVVFPARQEPKALDPARTMHFMKQWMKRLGVHSLGVTGLKDYHLYSHRGRGAAYGQEVKNQHPRAIAFTVEMEEDFTRTAPGGPVIIESSQQYLRSGTIALQLAGWIAKMGYEARAHLDGNYELICPLVARDAGLGEIGRMGLLMTPRLGPRVRIAVVTTNMPLPENSYRPNRSVIDFCHLCKKCADVCPSASISKEDRKEIDGVLRWQIDSESCFTYWTLAGTDCGRCMAACPYSHPDNALHNFIRWGIQHFYFFRRFALKMDDFFYGRKPKSGKIPSWLFLSKS